MQHVVASKGAPREVVPWHRPAPGEVEVAPGLVLADTAARFAAFAVDTLLLFVVDRAVSVVAGPASVAPTGPFENPREIVVSVAVIAIDAVYFIASWSGGRRATVGQRITRIEVGNGFDGAALSLGQATRRWLAFGRWVNLIGLIAPLSPLGGVALSIWTIALLWTTANSPTKQGLHDRFAHSVVARHQAGARGAWLVLFAMLAWFVVSIAWAGSLQGR